MPTQFDVTSDAQGRAKLTLTVNPTTTGANWSASVADNNSSYGGYAATGGSWRVTVGGQSVVPQVSGKSYDFGSGVISSPYFPRSQSGSVTLSPGTYTASASFSGDGTTVGSASVSFSFTVADTTPPPPTSYVVSFNSNGGSINPSQLSGSSSSPITLPSPGDKSGYTFSGWTYNGSNVGSVGASYTPTATVTLVASWSIIPPPPPGGGTTYYSYSYESNGGSSTPSGSGSVASGTAITLGSPGTKTGYSFAGWYIDSGLTSYAGNIGSSYAITANRIFYAKWSTSTAILPEFPSPAPALAQFIAGQAYTDTITASNMTSYNGVYSISIGSLPGGISGTVSTASDYSFTVTARNDNGTATQSYSGTIRGIMRIRQNEAWVKVIAKKREGQIWKPGTVRVWSNGTWLYGS
jgi:uncharacterized repeat protein (TIGR02543 family)